MHCPTSTISVDDFGVAIVRKYLQDKAAAPEKASSGSGRGPVLTGATLRALAVSTWRARDTEGGNVDDFYGWEGVAARGR